MKNTLSHWRLWILVPLILAALAGRATAVERVTAILSVTGATTNGNSVTVNGDTRTFTNSTAASPVSYVFTNSTTVGTASNLYFAVIASAFSGPVVPSWDTNVTVRLVGAPGQAMAVTVSGGWATVAYSTQTYAATLTVRVPVSAEAPSVKTNIASGLVEALQWGTNAVPTNAPALGNFAPKTNAPLTNPRIEGGTFSNGTFRGAGYMTNGALTNVAMPHSLSVTNFRRYGLSTGTGTNIETGVVRFNQSASIWDEDYVDQWDFLRQSLRTTNTVVRFMDLNSYSNSLYDVILDLSDFVEADFQDVATAGVFSGMTVQNTNNNWRGDLAYSPAFGVTSLVNGNNAGIELGTNVVSELSGATTIAQIAGFNAQRDGAVHWVRLEGAVTNIIVNEVSSTWSTDGTAANRIKTGTGGDLSLTNNPTWLQVRYRSTSSRWEIISAR